MAGAVGIDVISPMPMAPFAILSPGLSTTIALTGGASGAQLGARVVFASEVVQEDVPLYSFVRRGVSGVQLGKARLACVAPVAEHVGQLGEKRAQLLVNAAVKRVRRAEDVGRAGGVV